MTLVGTKVDEADEALDAGDEIELSSVVVVDSSERVDVVNSVVVDPA